ncbi:MFS transporter [Nonomuraea sp. NPDC005983]|uniref:MFS transporter n=1 Tax=Nonomuraea sp. NPDC005983 TaxID=3155595 RepID=UPI0033A4E0F5
MATVSARIRLTRDLPTWLVYLQLGTFATFLYGLSAALPLLRDDLHVSNAVAGLHGTAMAAGNVLTGLSLPVLTRRFGRRALVWAGLAGMSASVVLIVLVPAAPATLLGYGLGGALGSMALYSALAALSEHHGPAGAAAISEANGVAVVLGIGVSFLLSVAAQNGLGWRPALLVTPVLTAVLAAALGRVWVPERDRSAGGPHESGGRPGWRFHLAGAVLFCVVALEFCFNLWAAALFATNTGLSAARAATGLTAFTVGLAVGRFAGGNLALRLPPARLLVGAMLLTGAGWLVFWLGAQPVIGYAGLVIAGLGAALQFPLALAGMITASGDHPDRASAAAPIWAGVAMAVGPLLLGALADGFGTSTAFLLVPVLIGLAVCGVLSSRTR